MQVKLLQKVSGLRDGKEWPAAGATVDLPDAEAKALVASGLAERVEPAKGKRAST